MNSFLRRPCIAITYASLALCGGAFAHGDQDRPLFVAESGADVGGCLEERAPCRTIGYALNLAGKGGQIRVAAGTYEIANAEDIFHLISGVVDVVGGLELGAKPEIAERGVSVLTGVPFQYRELLESRGFQVVADRKGIENKKAAETDKLLDLHRQLKSSIPATPCVGGSAAGLPCSDVDLLSHVGFNDVSVSPTAGNDIWGFVDLNSGREYAIVGFNFGTAVFDVTDPTVPREVGFVDGQTAVWRDIKVYQFFDDAADRWVAYAYITTDGSTDGLFVVDLTGLPHSISRIDYPSDIVNAHNVYATNTDYGTGLSLTGNTPLLIVAGSNIFNGRYRIYSLADPTSPVFVSGGNGAGYMHDASSIVITDARKDTQCVNAGTYCEVLLDFNENTIEIWDVTNPATPALLSNTPYGNFGYTHSGWWSEDKQFVFVHDELDERDRGLPTTLRVFSVSDLTAPILAGTWTGPTSAIDHNGYVRGNRYYMSNYSRGLTVLDISNPAVPAAVGRIDTYPASDGTMFVGAWGAYPFFHSGNVAVSDIDSGFYMAKDQTRDVPQGSFTFAAASVASVEGQQAQLTVRRGGGSSGSVSVDYEILRATADDADFTASTGTLNWADGDAAEKTIVISATNDGVAENMERLIVRLIDPRGGATLGDLSTASVYLSDPGATAEVGFTTSAIDMAERGFATIVPILRRTGSAVGAVSVDYSVSAGDATAGSDFQGSTSGTISWADGDGDPKFLEFIIVDDGSGESDEFFDLTLGNPVGATISATPTLTATIRDGSGANLAPNAIAGANQVRASGSAVTLDGKLSNDPNNDILTFEWNQITGPTVNISGAGSPVATFTAPSVNSDTLLQFRLTVTDPGGLSDSATTNVTVTAAGAPPPSAARNSGGVVSPGVLLFLSLLFLGRCAGRRNVA